MKLCKTCGNLLGDTDITCQKCGTSVEANLMNQPAPMNPMAQVTPHQNMMNPMEQPVNQPIIQNAAPQKPTIMEVPMAPVTPIQPKVEPPKNNDNKKYKLIIGGLVAAFIIIIGVLSLQIGSLKKEVKKAKSETNTNYKFNNNQDTTSNQVQINANDDNYNFDIPEGTYPKVSQNHVFFIQEEYVATVLEQSGGISLLNLKTGGSGWIAMNNATLEAYRGQREALKQTYISQGVKVNNMYDTTLGGKDSLVLEITNGQDPTLLIIVDGPQGGCFVLTITNTTDKTNYDMQTANDLVAMVGNAKRLG